MSKKTSKVKKQVVKAPMTDADRFKRIVRGVSVHVVEFPWINRFGVEITGTISFSVPGSFKTRPEALAVAKEWRAFFKRMKEGVYTADLKKRRSTWFCGWLMAEPLVEKVKRTADRVRRAKTKTPRDRNLTLVDRAHAELDGDSFADEVHKREFEGS